jgi:hypothetical protein
MTGSCWSQDNTKMSYFNWREIDNIGVKMVTSHRKSLHQLAVQSGMSKFSTLTVIQLLTLCPYESTPTQQRFPVDLEARSCCYRLFQESVAYGFLNLEHMLFLEEIWFTLNGNACSQNNTYWCSEKTHTIHEALLQHFKVRAWCAVSACRII